MLTVPNFISLMRAPLALCFLQENHSIRLVALLLVLGSDCLDGFIARRFGWTSHSGEIMDPLMDKIFVFFVLGVFMTEQQLNVWQVGAMVSRDICLVLFGFYIGLAKGWRGFQYQSLLWGKVTTAFQYVVLIGVCLSISFPWYVFAFFIILGALSFRELFLKRMKVEG